MSTYISPADLEAAREFVRAYRIDLHNPRLALDVDTIDPYRQIAVRQFERVQRELERYREFHRENPFSVAPAGVFDGDIVLCTQMANQLPVTVHPKDLTRHLGIFGSSGCGKTTFTYNVVRQLRARQMKVFILDPKNDSLHIAARDQDFLIISPTAKLNLLQRPDFLSQDEWVNVLTHVWCSEFYSGENQKQELDAATEQALTQHTSPCLADVKEIVSAPPSTKLSFQRRDARTGVENRLARFGRMFPGPYHTRVGITWNELFKHPLYMDALFNDEHTTFIYTLLVYLLYLHNRRYGIRDTLDYLLVNDEGNRFWNAKQNNIRAEPPLVGLQGRIRELGLGLLHTSVDQATLHPILKSNTQIRVAMNVTSGREEAEVARNLRLRAAHRDYYPARLKRGNCIISVGDNWSEPILCSFPYREQPKHVSRESRNDAEARINRYAPTELPPTIESEPSSRPEQATTPKPPASPKRRSTSSGSSDVEQSRAASRAKPGPTNTPARHAEPASTNSSDRLFPVDEPRRVPVKLTANEERLLRITLERLLTATEAYRLAGLARQAGQTAKDKLVTLGLLSSGSILVKAGRGGNALVLEPTSAGLELLGRQRPCSTKGGDSLQHRYLIQELDAAIPKAKIEVSIGEKSVDILVPYDPKLHKRLLFNIETKEIAEGALLAVEIEVSDPVKTGEINITKNHEVGILHTIVAVLPKHVEKTKKALATNLPAELQDAYTVVDVFALLEGCEQ